MQYCCDHLAGRGWGWVRIALGPISLIFMQFFWQKFYHIKGWRPPSPLGSAPRLENPVLTTVLCADKQCSYN